jgi:hypothetical protein
LEGQNYLINNIFTRRERENHPEGKEQQSFHRTDNDLLILTRLLSSSDDKC